MDMTPLFTFKTGIVSGKTCARGKPTAGERIIVNGKLLCCRRDSGGQHAFTTNSPLNISWGECSFIGVDDKKRCDKWVFMKQGKLQTLENGLEFFLDDIA